MKRREGFTLIEVVVSILVLAIGLLAALSLVTTGLRWGREVKDKTMAVVVARSLVDDPTLIDEAADPAADGTLQGYVEDFYAVREAGAVSLEVLATPDATVHSVEDFAGALSDYSGTFQNVHVTLYEGVIAGDVSTGDLVFEISAKRYHRY